MIFNSYTFLLAFLPIALAVFALIRRFAPRAAFGWLVLASLAFYGVWNPHPAEPWTPKYVLLILGSCAANYFIGRYLSGHKATRHGKTALVAGIAANLALLGYFKYAGFLAGIATAAHRLARRDSADRPAARHLVLHLPADRLPGRRLARRDRGIQLHRLRALRHFLPPPDRRPDGAPPRR